MSISGYIDIPYFEISWEYQLQEDVDPRGAVFKFSWAYRLQGQIDFDSASDSKISKWLSISGVDIED